MSQFWVFTTSCALMLAAMLSIIQAAAEESPSDGSRQKLREDCRAEGQEQRCSLTFEGRIDVGDARLLEKRILASRGVVEGIEFNSPGGSALEGLKIGEILNKYFVMMHGPICWQKDNKQMCFEFKSSLPAMCASACAIALLVADNRNVGHDAFLHRPYFPASQFAGLSATEAREKYQKMSAALVAALHERGVGEDVTTAIMDTPSDQAVQLRENYPRFSPWLEEWVKAKCGSDLTKDEDKTRDFLLARVMMGLSDVERAEWDRLNAKSNRYNTCAYKSMLVEARRAQNK